MNKFIVSTSPHITSTDTTQKIMLDVIIALIPAMLATIFIYGFYPLFMIVLCVGSAVFSEWVFNVITKRKQSVRDLSAIVTGIILALNLPPVVPFYVPMIGAAFAIIIVKMLFGGIGRNFANPAIVARIFLMLAWTGVMTSFVAPIDLSDGANLFTYFQNAVHITLPDAITTATPLGLIKGAIAVSGNPSAGLNALDMFLGRIGGSSGEVCSLAVLIGGIYLTARRVIDVRIPLIYIGSTVVFTAMFFANTGFVGEYIWTYLLSGGLLFGAFFMATDYATSPKSMVAVLLYGVGLGFLTVLIRKFSSMNEGVSFAILLMNIATPLLEKIKPKVFGTPKRDFAKMAQNKKAANLAKKQAKLEGEAQNG
ncbi:MAG: RnfABCDGE type electron transport complex subunit D [Clostridia bacterium]